MNDITASIVLISSLGIFATNILRSKSIKEGKHKNNLLLIDLQPFLLFLLCSSVLLGGLANHDDSFMFKIAYFMCLPASILASWDVLFGKNRKHSFIYPIYSLGIVCFTIFLVGFTIMNKIIL